MPRKHRLTLLAALLFGLVGIPVSRNAGAQNPSPTSFMHSVTPAFQEPNDGASVLVVEGVGGGLGGCASSLDTIVYITVTAVNAGRPTITEFSPQGPGNCGGATAQDWKNVVLQIVSRVESGAPTTAGTWWGGVMLDEETGTDFGWPSRCACAAAYEDLNASAATLMSSQPGISWYYTETFAGPGDWSQSDFNAITGGSHAAPQIASDYMVTLTNAMTGGQRAVLVTWSLAYPAGFNSLVLSAGRINGAPYNQWGLNLSNCFTTGVEVCNDWDADGVLNASDNCPSAYNPLQTNTDAGNAALNHAGYDNWGDACDDNLSGDGYTNEAHTALGKNPVVYCSIMRADVNGDGFVNVLDITQAAGFFLRVFTHDYYPPNGLDAGIQRLDQNGDNNVNVLDLTIMNGQFLHGVTACP